MPSGNFNTFTTGVTGLDTILGGGIPVGSLVFVTGLPGSGKTILIQQICFSWATQHRPTSQTAVKDKDETTDSNGKKKPRRKPGEGMNRAVYFSTLSEPHDKLLDHVRQFEFFQDELFAENIRLYSLSSTLDQGFDKIADLIISTVRQQQAGLVALDGFDSLEIMAQSRDTVRRFLYRLSSQLSVLGTTMIIASERPTTDLTFDGNLAVGDGIIVLASHIVGAREYRRVEIRKLRGMNPLLGRHTYQISQQGLTFFPRIETIIPAELDWHGVNHDTSRAKLGIPSIDELLGGGLPRTSTTVLAGPPGVGKTVLGLHFLMEGVQQGEKGLMLSFHESREQLFHKAAAFDLNLQQAVEQGQLVLINRSPVEIEPDQIAALLREQIETGEIKRLVLDDLLELDRATHYENRGFDYMAALIHYLKDHRVSSLYTYVVSKLVGTELDLGESPIALLAENLLLLRQLDDNQQVYKTLSILQMRESRHDKNSYHYTLESGKGIRLLSVEQA